MSTPTGGNIEGTTWTPVALADLENAGSQTLSMGLKGKVVTYFPYQFKEASYRHRHFLNTPRVEGLLPLHPVYHPRPTGLLRNSFFWRMLPFKG